MVANRIFKKWFIFGGMIWLFGASVAAAAPQPVNLQPVKELSSEWLQKLYLASLEEKKQTPAAGLCVVAQATYAFTAERKPTDEDVFVSVLEAAKKVVNDSLDPNDNETQLVVVSGGIVDIAKSAEVDRYFERAILSKDLSRFLQEHAGEFNWDQKLLFHVDTFYARKKTAEHPDLTSFIRSIAVFDLAAQELMIYGNGECEF